MSGRILAVGMVFLAGSVLAEDVRITSARQALDDGLPQVAIFRLQQAKGKWPSDEDKAAASLLLGRAQFSAGRFADAEKMLRDVPRPNAKADFWLAETRFALGDFAGALPLYRQHAGDPEFSERAAIGESRTLISLGQTAEAVAVLSDHLGKNSQANDAVIELARNLVSMRDAAGAQKALSLLKEPSATQQANASYLAAKALMLLWKYGPAEEQLTAIQDPPAALAADIVIARAECLLGRREAGDAEKILEAFVEENSRLPGLRDVFSTLDRVYAAETGASSSELRKWGDDDRDPVRAGFAEYYEARNEARLGNVEKSRQVFRNFLGKNPGHVLANSARVQLAESFVAAGKVGEAWQVLQDGSGPRVEFLKGQALASQDKYGDAAASFLAAASLAEIQAPALSNSAICGILAGVPDAQNKAVQALKNTRDGAKMLEKILYYEALHEAARRNPDAGEKLRQIADGESRWAENARLALAEWDNLQLNIEGARSELRKISSAEPAQKERADYLAVFLADTGDPEAGAEVINLAEIFFKTYPKSAFAPEVRMKLGEILFRRGDYLGAHGQFAKIAEQNPDSPLAEKAEFLSAQAMSRSLNPQAMEQALEIYNNVAQAGGPLALRARLSQAMLFNSLKRPKDALGVIESILGAKPDSELRFMTLVEQGDTLFALGSEDPENFNRAIAAWQQIASDPSAGKEWNHQALVKMGAAHAKLGKNDTALDCYYRVFSDGQKGQPEYFWYYKAGFDAGRLLETQKLWKEAIAVYEKIGSVDGPRAGEARDRVNKLRLENFIWDN